MLGHIAISTMGGCFSQNPDTGAAEATYFPAESVEIARSIRKSIRRAAGTTDFEDGFTQTRYWLKELFSTENTAAFSVVSLGAVEIYNTTRRCCAMYAHYGKSIQRFSNISGDDGGRATRFEDPITFYKELGTTTHVYTNEPSRLAPSFRYTNTTRKDADVLANIQFTFEINPGFAPFPFRFYGDLFSNDAYAVHWRRLPMQRVGQAGVALYDADGAQFIEY